MKEMLKNKRKKQVVKERGITLIALVVTIIILLILTGVTINISLEDNGLFSKSQDAADKYKKTEQDALSSLSKLENKLENTNINYNDYIGTYVNGYEPKNNKECIIGPTATGVINNKDANNKDIENMDESKNQKFTTEEEIKWKIWDYNPSTQIIRLISDKPTDTKLTLYGATGYNNGVWAINEVCRQCYGQYNSNGEKKEGIDVANLSKSDVQKIINYDYTQYSHDEEDSIDVNGAGLYKYGNVKVYDKIKYPKMWYNFDKDWNYKKDENGTVTGINEKDGTIWEEENDYTAVEGTEDINEKVEVKQSYWRKDYDANTINLEDWTNPKYYELLFGNVENHFKQTYWLSSRYVIIYSAKCNFGDFRIWGNTKEWRICGNALYSALPEAGSTCSDSLRPVVSINLETSGYKLQRIVDNDGNVSFSLI